MANRTHALSIYVQGTCATNLIKKNPPKKRVRDDGKAVQTKKQLLICTLASSVKTKVVSIKTSDSTVLNHSIISKEDRKCAQLMV